MKRFLMIMTLTLVALIQMNAQHDRGLKKSTEAKQTDGESKGTNVTIEFGQGREDSLEYVNQLLNQAEASAKMADENPNDGKMQWRAAEALSNDRLEEKRDLDRALVYAERALDIALKQTTLADTLKGLSYYTLGIINLKKQQDLNKCCDLLLKANDALEEELGINNPFTNNFKLVTALMMMNLRPTQSFVLMEKALYDNSMASEENRIQNIDDAYFGIELVIEMLIADYTKRYRYALPVTDYKGKKYYIVQNRYWSMERPLVGWMTPVFLPDLNGKTDKTEDKTILCDENHQFIIEDKDKMEIKFSTTYNFNTPRQLLIPNSNVHIVFLKAMDYDEIQQKFREFKANMK